MCAQEAISTKSAGRKWLVSGLEDHRYLSVTKSATRREPVGGTPTSKQEPCSGMHLMLSLSTGPWICHISSRVQVCTDSNGNAESPSPPPLSEAWAAGSSGGRRRRRQVQGQPPSLECARPLRPVTPWQRTRTVLFCMKVKQTRTGQWPAQY